MVWYCEYDISPLIVDMFTMTQLRRFCIFMEVRATVRQLFTRPLSLIWPWFGLVEKVIPSTTDITLALEITIITHMVWYFGGGGVTKGSDHIDLKSPLSQAIVKRGSMVKGTR